MIHRSASASAAGLTRQVRTRPAFCETTRPEVSSTARCCITAGSDMSSGRLSSLTEAGPCASRWTIARRVGSARAWNAWSSGISLLSILLSIIPPIGKQVLYGRSERIIPCRHPRGAPRRRSRECDRHLKPLICACRFPRHVQSGPRQARRLFHCNLNRSRRLARFEFARAPRLGRRPRQTSTRSPNGLRSSPRSRPPAAWNTEPGAA